MNPMDLLVNKIFCGDCLNIMKNWPDNCIDTIITDPPYGLGFMGKDWDTFDRDHLDQKRRADKKRKPRTNGRTVAAWNNAGDAGTFDHSRNAEFQQWFTIWAKECLRVCKPGAMMLIFGGTRTYHRLTCAIEDAGWLIRDCVMWLYGSGFPKGHNISRQYQIQRHGWRGKCLSNFVMGKGYFEQRIGRWRLEKTWDGQNVALKPAWEPIIVAMKPLDGTFAANAEKHGVAGLNIDGGRIGEETRFNQGAGNKPGGSSLNMSESGMPEFEGKQCQGRWPANLILDEEAAAMLDEQSGISISKQRRPEIRNYRPTGNQIVDFGGGNKHSEYSDSGGASRFFYCAKASRSERGKDNKHPTVKPLKLMEYLCILTKTPAGGVVLDPFAGSGTTGMACVKTGRNYILIEKEPEYCKIAGPRIAEMKRNIR